MSAPALRRRTLAAALAALALACAHGGRRDDGTVGAAQVGLASYYASHHHGNRTASGARYDERKLTCAHRTLPFGTRLRVTNLANDRSVVVEVTDRGPFVAGRIVDLSRAAARQLGLLERGVAKVRVERLR